MLKRETVICTYMYMCICAVRISYASLKQGFGSAFFFCGSGSWGDPGEGAGVKGKNDFFFEFFFTFQMILNNGCLKSEQKK